MIHNVNAAPFPCFEGPYGHVYWLEPNHPATGCIVAAPLHQDGTFQTEDPLPLDDFAEPLTHGQTIDVLLGIGACAIRQAAAYRDLLEGMTSYAEDAADEIGVPPPPCVQAARNLLGIPDGWSVQDYRNLRDPAYIEALPTEPLEPLRSPEDDNEHDDTPCLEDGRDNCNDYGTGEGRFHGRM